MNPILYTLTWEAAKILIKKGYPLQSEKWNIDDNCEEGGSNEGLFFTTQLGVPRWVGNPAILSESHNNGLKISTIEMLWSKSKWRQATPTEVLKWKLPTPREAWDWAWERLRKGLPVTHPVLGLFKWRRGEILKISEAGIPCKVSLYDQAILKRSTGWTTL